jgi:hypothetical protein
VVSPLPTGAAAAAAEASDGDGINNRDVAGEGAGDTGDAVKKADEVGLYTLMNAVDPSLESVWFQPLSL